MSDATKYESMVGGVSKDVQDYTLKNMVEKAPIPRKKPQVINSAAKADRKKNGGLIDGCAVRGKTRAKTR